MLDKQFVADGLFQVARGFGVSGTFKTKKAALGEIERRLRERKEGFERTRF
jgi:hypothetical protein